MYNADHATACSVTDQKVGEGLRIKSRLIVRMEGRGIELIIHKYPFLFAIYKNVSIQNAIKAKQYREARTASKTFLSFKKK